MTTSVNRISSFRYALSGCAYMLRYQKNTRIMSASTIAVVVVGLWLGIGAMDWALLLLTVALVWISEFINAAIEAAVNVAGPQYHPMAKVAKDVAAGTVLLASVAAFVIGLLILGPPLLDTLGGSTALP